MSRFAEAFSAWIREETGVVLDRELVAALSEYDVEIVRRMRTDPDDLAKKITHLVNESLGGKKIDYKSAVKALL